MTGKRIVVIGANGFVGRAIVTRLVADGHHVDAVVRDSDRAVPAGARRVAIPNFTAPGALDAVTDGADTLLNAAGRAHVIDETSSDQLAAFRGVNVELARSLAAAATRARVPLYIEISSVAAVCERADSTLTRRTTPNPSSPYGISKLEAETVALSAGDQTRVVVLRPPMIYGPGMKGNPLRLFRLLDRRLPLPIGAVDNRRSMLFIENLAAATAAVVASPNGNCGAYFVADAEPISTTRFARAASVALGVQPRLLSIPLPLLRVCGFVGDVIHRVRRWPLTSATLDRLTSSLVLDTSDFQRDFAFVPPVSFDSAIQQTAAWYASTRSEAEA